MTPSRRPSRIQARKDKDASCRVASLNLDWISDLKWDMLTAIMIKDDIWACAVQHHGLGKEDAWGSLSTS